MQMAALKMACHQQLQQQAHQTQAILEGQLRAHQALVWEDVQRAHAAEEHRQVLQAWAYRNPRKAQVLQTRAGEVLMRAGSGRRTATGQCNTPSPSSHRSHRRGFSRSGLAPRNSRSMSPKRRSMSPKRHAGRLGTPAPKKHARISSPLLEQHPDLQSGVLGQVAREWPACKATDKTVPVRALSSPASFILAVKKLRPDKFEK